MHSNLVPFSTIYFLPLMLETLFYQNDNLKIDLQIHLSFVFQDIILQRENHSSLGSNFGAIRWDSWDICDRKNSVEDDQELEYYCDFNARITLLSLERNSPPHVIAIGLMTILSHNTMQPLLVSCLAIIKKFLTFFELEKLDKTCKIFRTLKLTQYTK